MTNDEILLALKKKLERESQSLRADYHTDQHVNVAYLIFKDGGELAYESISGVLAVRYYPNEVDLDPHHYYLHITRSQWDELAAPYQAATMEKFKKWLEATK